MDKWEKEVREAIAEAVAIKVKEFEKVILCAREVILLVREHNVPRQIYRQRAVEAAYRLDGAISEATRPTGKEE